MTRLNCVVEGHSEEIFINEVVVQHLSGFGVYASVCKVSTSRKNGRKHSGGLTSYQKFKNDMEKWLKQEPKSYFTCMVDFYALPSDFPSYTEAQKIVDIYEKIIFLEDALKVDIGYHKFIPYIQLHEFEALIFAYPDCLKRIYSEPEHEIKIQTVKTIAEQFENPEHINHSPETAPSKRLAQIFEQYTKTWGAEALAGCDIDILKQHNPHFKSWIERLERLK